MEYQAFGAKSREVFSMGPAQSRYGPDQAVPGRDLVTFVAGEATRRIMAFENTGSLIAVGNSPISAAGQRFPHQVHVINPDSSFSLHHQVEPDQIGLMP